MNSYDDIAQPRTTKQCTKRDNPPCPDGGQGGDAGFDIFKLTCAAEFVHALADIIEAVAGRLSEKADGGDNA